MTAAERKRMARASLRYCSEPNELSSAFSDHRVLILSAKCTALSCDNCANKIRSTSPCERQRSVGNPSCGVLVDPNVSEQTQEKSGAYYWEGGDVIH